MKSKHSQKYHRPVAIDISRMMDLYESGLSLEAVGKRFGISKQRVAQIFDKAGVKKRNFTKTNKYVKGQKSRRRIIPKETLIELSFAPPLYRRRFSFNQDSAARARQSRNSQCQRKRQSSRATRNRFKEKGRSAETL
ncbi:MAG: hypothetical protein LC778_01590 [Acidobacteria bacterium]|nr:hypothetical protein [Acidobacteriota bacterium]